MNSNDKPPSLLGRLWARVSDQTKPPRAWWYPPTLRTANPSPEVLLGAHEKCSDSVNRTMLSLLAFALFCLMTSLGASDSSLLKTEPTIKVPLTDLSVSFIGFLVVAPLLLIVTLGYLHIFYGYWLEHERDRQTRNRDLPNENLSPVESLPTLFYFDHPLPRLLTTLIFYWLTPLTLMVITWKAAALPIWGPVLGCVTGLVTFVLVFLGIRRCPPARRRWWNPPRWAMLALIVALEIFVASKPETLRRPFDLFRANLNKAWLAEADLRFAELSHADLQGANLQFARLQGTKLFRANLQGADLFRADLEKADVSSANMREAKLPLARLLEAELGAAELEGSDLSKANLQGAGLLWAKLKGSKLQGANLRAVRLQGADLREADLDGAELGEANLQGADLRGANLSTSYGLTAAQISDATNWSLAFCPEGLLKELGLPSNHNRTLARRLAKTPARVAPSVAK